MSWRASRRNLLILEVLALMGLFVPSVFGHVFYRATWYDHSPKVASPAWDFVAQQIHTLATAGVILYVIFASGDPLEQFGLGPIRGSKAWIIAAITGLVALVANNATMFILVPPRMWSSMYLSQANYPVRLNDAFLEGVNVLLARTTIELIFRGYLITRLQELFRSPVMAVSIQALVFDAIVGGGNLEAFVYMAFQGLVLGLLFLLARSIWPLALGAILFSVLTWCFMARTPGPSCFRVV